jgi:hypothetical protein
VAIDEQLLAAIEAQGDGARRLLHPSMHIEVQQDTRLDKRPAGVRERLRSLGVPESEINDVVYETVQTMVKLDARKFKALAKKYGAPVQAIYDECCPTVAVGPKRVIVRKLDNQVDFDTDGSYDKETGSLPTLRRVVNE